MSAETPGRGEPPPTAAQPGGIVPGVCPLCGPVDLRLLPFRYEFRGRSIYGVSCTSCSLTFLDPMLSDDEIRDLYTEEYYTECSESCGAHGPRAYMELVEISAAERAASARRLDALLSRALGRKGRLFEVGCGPGYFLLEMQKLGWEVRGIEISQFAADHAREKLGLDVAVGPILPGALTASWADAVFLGDVLEHLPRPLESLEAARSWLRPGGVLAVAVPSSLNLVSARIGMALYRGRGRFKRMHIPPYHLFEYTPSTLARMISAAGFTMITLHQSAVPIHRMGLRGAPWENLGKVAFQFLALASSRLANRRGDRLLALARRHEEPAGHNPGRARPGHASPGSLRPGRPS